MPMSRAMLSQLDIEVERRLCAKFDLWVAKLTRGHGWAVNDPTLSLSGLVHCRLPQPKATLFAHMNLLPAPDQTYHHAPVGNAIRELNEQFRLRATLSLPMFDVNLTGIECALRFIEYEDVLGGHSPTGVRFDVVKDVPNKRLPAAPRIGRGQRFERRAAFRDLLVPASDQESA
jgi:hypothetical protein